MTNDQVVEIPYWAAVKPFGRFSESLRTLRSGIPMTDVDDPPKIIQFTSTIPSEGKTTIAISLAISAAAAGQKVMFIDADLRHPSASNFLGLQKKAGLVDLLLGTGPKDVVNYVEKAKIGRRCRQ